MGSGGKMLTPKRNLSSIGSELQLKKLGHNKLTKIANIGQKKMKGHRRTAT